MYKFKIIIIALFTGWLAACEKPLQAEEEHQQQAAEGNLKLSVYELEQTPFLTTTRATASEACSHLVFAVYGMDGTKLKQNSQKIGDSDYGSTSFQLLEGSYQLVAIAHSSDNNPTMSDLHKIKFSNSTGYSDTFLYYQTIEVGSQPQTINLSLRRIVSLCRFVINDAVPEGITKLEFYYTGGSGHFDATTGKGVTNSQQKVRVAVEAGQQQTQVDLYTILHEDEGLLRLKVTAYDAADNVQHEAVFEDIPMTRNQITWLSGDFFTGVMPVASRNFSTDVDIETVWGGELRLTY